MLPLLPLSAPRGSRLRPSSGPVLGGGAAARSRRTQGGLGTTDRACTLGLGRKSELYQPGYVSLGREKKIPLAGEWDGWNASVDGDRRPRREDPAAPQAALVVGRDHGVALRAADSLAETPRTPLEMGCQAHDVGRSRARAVAGAVRTLGPTERGRRRGGGSGQGLGRRRRGWQAGGELALLQAQPQFGRHVRKEWSRPARGAGEIAEPAGALTMSGDSGGSGRGREARPGRRSRAAAAEVNVPAPVQAGPGMHTLPAGGASRSG
jgi:hypothetical protein